jgi:hypothetical protein
MLGRDQQQLASVMGYQRMVARNSNKHQATRRLMYSPALLQSVQASCSSR